MDFNDRLRLLLLKKRQIDLEIEQVITENYNGKVRFSSKKFVGDLGELYFYNSVPLFSELAQSSTSNNDYDFIGKLYPKFSGLFGLNSVNVRIEIKTRHAQEGNNHLFGINTQKFDLLAFVALTNDFQCRHIGIINSSDITVDRQNRIRYSDYYRKGLVKWKTTEWMEL